MWKLRGALLGLLLGSAGLVSAAGLTPTAGASDFVAATKLSLCAELAVLDGGPLTRSLTQALERGVILRLVLDPTERGVRDQGRALLAAARSNSATAQALQLRWLKGAGRAERRLLGDGQQLLRWKAGQEPRRDDGAVATFLHRFEHRWPEASTELPEGLTLDDDLKALPDPREQDPRISRRREASGE